MVLAFQTNWRSVIPDRSLRWSLILVFWMWGDSVGVIGAREPRISLQQGTIAGVLVYGDGAGAVRAFLAVPYAVPPVDGLRLQPPQRHPGWNGTLRAQRSSPPCPQLNNHEESYSEDCLYLDVWTPEGANGLPVLAWLWDSSAAAPPCQELSLWGAGAVVATIRARRGPLAVGGLTLLDQYLALVWLRTNAPFLGGDSSAITLLGRGTSADDVLHHLISPRTNGLVSRFAIMSPTLLGLQAEAAHRIEQQLLLETRAAELLGCGGSTRRTSCYRYRSVQEIFAAYKLAFQDTLWWDWPMTDRGLPKEQQYLPLSLEEWLDNQNDPVQRYHLLLGRIANIESHLTSDDQSHSTERDLLRLLAEQYSNNTILTPLVISAIRWEYGQTSIAAAEKDSVYWHLCDQLSMKVQRLYVYNLHTEVREVDESVLLAGGALLRKAERLTPRPPGRPPLRDHLLQFLHTGSPLQSWLPWDELEPRVCELNGQPAIEDEVRNKESAAVQSAKFWSHYLPDLVNSLFINAAVTDSAKGELAANSGGSDSGDEGVIRGALVGGVCVLLALLALLAALLHRSLRRRAEPTPSPMTSDIPSGRDWRRHLPDF